MSRRSWNTRSAGRSVWEMRNCASQSSRFRWKAGAMMWLGVSSRSWMMYSPRSVSTGSMPCCWRCALMPELLRDHRLALGHGAGAGVLADLQHDARASSAVAAPMHLAASALHVGGECFQVEVEVGQRVVLDVPPDVAQPLELRQIGDRGAAPCHELRLAELQRLLEPGIGQRALRVGLELGRACSSMRAPSARPGRLRRSAAARR